MSKALTWSRGRTRSGDDYFAGFIEEIQHSFDQEINRNLKGDSEWNQFDCYTIASRLVMGPVAKLLAGEECRNSESIDLFCDYTAAMLVGGPYIRRFPELLKP